MMMQRMTRLFIGILTAVTALMLTACKKDVIYSRYTHAAIGGWEKNEPLVFEVDSLKAGGVYSLTLGLRISDGYPFRNLHMVVEQTIFPGNQLITDTVTCYVSDRQGTMLGNGVSLYQYDLPVRKRQYMAGDSIHVKVRHNMKREILPGIADVGITIKPDRQ